MHLFVPYISLTLCLLLILTRLPPSLPLCQFHLLLLARAGFVQRQTHAHTDGLHLTLTTNRYALFRTPVLQCNYSKLQGLRASTSFDLCVLSKRDQELGVGYDPTIPDHCSSLASCDLFFDGRGQCNTAIMATIVTNAVLDSM